MVSLGVFFTVAGITDSDSFAHAKQAPVFALIAATLACIRLIPAQPNKALDTGLGIATGGAGFSAAYNWLMSENANLGYLLVATVLTIVSIVCYVAAVHGLGRQSEGDDMSQPRDNGGNDHS